MKNTKMLKKNYEYRRVLTKGKYYTGKYIEVFIQSNNLKCNYLGLAISSKIGKAVTRNHIKRLIRENYKIVEEDIKTGYNIVILWKRNADTKEAVFCNIKEDLNAIINKSKLKKEN